LVGNHLVELLWGGAEAFPEPEAAAEYTSIGRVSGDVGHAAVARAAALVAGRFVSDAEWAQIAVEMLPRRSAAE
jgi:hypothetical protein